MIDFRYHLVSIVAVLLALAAGVVLGSGFVGGPLLDDIERRADDIRDTNTELRQEADRDQRVIQDQDLFASEVEPRLIAEALSGTTVVVIEAQGTSREAREGLRESLSLSGATLAGTIEITDRFGVEDDVPRDELALIVGSTEAEADDIVADAATTLGSRLAGTAASSPSGARARLQELLDGLQQADFISLREADDGPIVPTGATFVVLAGAGDPAPFEVGRFLTTVATAIGERDRPVLVSETSDSEWGVIEEVRGDSEAVEVVATASGVELAAGRIAAILTLELALEGEVGHFGIGSGASTVLPDTSDTSD